MAEKKFKVALWGTGAAAIEFIEALHEHPQAEIIEVYGNSSAGKQLGEVMIQTALIQTSLAGLGRLVIRKIPGDNELIRSDADIHCCALSDDESAKERVKNLEARLAAEKPTFSTASVWRYEPDSFILIPEVNYERAHLVFEQAANRNWKGFISPGSNCTSVGPIVSLAAMGIIPSEIVGVYFDSKQAVSGAGEKERRKLLEQRAQMAHCLFDPEAWKGQNIYEGNVRCNIKDEVKKVRSELIKIAGLPSNIPINGMTYRVPVEYGHVVSMVVQTRNPVDIELVKANIRGFDSFCGRRFGDLHSSPEVFVRVVEDDFGPQPLLEAEKYGGMCTHIGQLRPLEGMNGILYSVLSHNLKKGAGKGVVQNIEFFIKEGMIR